MAHDVLFSVVASIIKVTEEFARTHTQKHTAPLDSKHTNIFGNSSPAIHEHVVILFDYDWQFTVDHVGHQPVHVLTMKIWFWCYSNAMG